MALGNPLLPDPQQDWTLQNGTSIPICFDGSSDGRVTHTALESISEGTHSYRLEVIETNEADFFRLTVGGSTISVIGSDAIGVYEDTMDSAGTDDLIRLYGDGVEAKVTLQVWPGTPD